MPRRKIIHDHTNSADLLQSSPNCVFRKNLHPTSCLMENVGIKFQNGYRPTGSGNHFESGILSN